MRIGLPAATGDTHTHAHKHKHKHTYTRQVPTFLRTVKIPYPSVAKRVGLTNRWCGNTKTLHSGKRNKKLGGAVLWLLAFPVKSSLYFPCNALEQESDLI